MTHCWKSHALAHLSIDNPIRIGLTIFIQVKCMIIHKYNVKIIGSDSKPVACLGHLLDML